MAAVVALFVVGVVTAPPSFAAPSLNVSAKDGLKDGQTVTISGGGFEPGLSNIAVGQCSEGYVGPADCNVQTGATFRTADGGGSIGEFTIVVKEKFGSTDCTVDKCVIAAAPLPTAADEATIAANEVIIPITFGEAAETPPEDGGGDDEGDEGEAGELPKTGLADAVPVIAISALLLLGLGGALRFGFRRQGGVA
jgi:LPXTG-motif cell wall-anchored protein